MDNYIILRASGNTYFGALASKFSYRLKLPKIHRLCESEKVYVFEVMPDDSVVLRAGQETQEAAGVYMGPNRVMVWREDA
jgi:hypothetical protein